MIIWAPWYKAYGLHPTAVDWAARVVINGGAAPSSGTILALSKFCYCLDGKSLTSSMLGVCCFVPDSVIAAITPLIVGTGHDPWTNMGSFVSGDLSVNGLIGDGSSKYLKTGLIGANIFTSINDFGISLYCATDDTGSTIEVGVNNAGDPSNSTYNLNSSAVDLMTAWTGPSQIGGSLPGGFHGFHCGTSKVGPGWNLYIANSGTPRQLTGSGTPIGVLPTIEYYVFGSNTNGALGPTPSARRISFAAFHHGLTATQITDLFNCTQAMRTGLGGGYV